MVPRENIRRRLSKLKEYLAILRRLARYNLDEFLREPEHYGAAERFLQLAIEALTDIGAHVVVNLNLGEIAVQSDVPRTLADKGYIDPELAETWIKMIGFRNILVHEYLEIDRRTVYRILRTRLGDIETLARELAKLA